METVMDRFLAAALAAALTTSSGVALAQSQPGAPTSEAPAKPATKAPGVHHTRVVHGDTDTKALNLLEANGYTDIRQFRRVGQHYEAVTTKGGKSSTVVVDPATGEIRNRA
jgi:hypothetical protein